MCNICFAVTSLEGEGEELSREGAERLSCSCGNSRENFLTTVFYSEPEDETVTSRAVARMDEKLLLTPGPVTCRYAKSQENNNQNSLDPYPILESVILK